MENRNISDGAARRSVFMSARDITYTALFTALICVCSWISLPLVIPVTLQTFAVFVTVGLLGMKRGLIAVLLYILLGAVGLPVFSGFRGGFGVLAGATGGYIVGFIFQSLIQGLICIRYGSKPLAMIVSMLMGLLVCYAFGTAWFAIAYAPQTGAVGILTALSMCVVPFIVPDLCKLAIAVFVIHRIGGRIRR